MTEPSTLSMESRSYSRTGGCRPGGSHRDIYLKWKEVCFSIYVVSDYFLVGSFPRKLVVPWGIVPGVVVPGVVVSGVVVLKPYRLYAWIRGCHYETSLQSKGVLL